MSHFGGTRSSADAFLWRRRWRLRRRRGTWRTPRPRGSLWSEKNISGEYDCFGVKLLGRSQITIHCVHVGRPHTVLFSEVTLDEMGHQI